MYTQLAEIPVPTTAQFITPDVIRLSSSIKDHVQNIKRTMVKLVSTKKQPPETGAFSYQDIGNIVAHVVSPSLKRRAMLVEVKGQEVKRYVEVWVDDRREVSMDVTNEHGAFYTHDVLSSLSFSSTEISLLYTAEAKSPTNDDPYARFRYVPQFGEDFAGKRRPTTYIFSWGNQKNDSKPKDAAILKALSPSLSRPVLFGQAVFSSHDENKIYATGYEYMPDGRLLGVQWCNNRPSGIWELTVQSSSAAGSPSGGALATAMCDAKKLTPGHLSCCSPRINGSTLFWLASPTGGAHASTSSLHSLDVSSASSSGNVRTLVDLVFDPSQEDFPGLYLSGPSLSHSPFLRLRQPSTDFLITESIWRSRSTVVLISATDGSVRDLTPDVDGLLYSWTVLGTDGAKRVVCTRSSIGIPPEVVLGEFGDGGDVTWRVVEKHELSAEVKAALSRLRISIVPIPGHHPTETILIQSSDPQNAGDISPCLTFPHGGPHSATTTAFSPYIAAYALEGYTVSAPNYTGSVGFGETAVRALLGKCGTLDVEDCIASVRHLIHLGIAQEGPGKQFVTGGSHGGFLSAHLVGQYPDVFSAVVMRNPVISSGEISTSDIPDWYFAEFGVEYPLSSSPGSGSDTATTGSALTPVMTPEIYAKLYAASPIAHVDAVRVPVQIHVGTVDLRVAPTQGIGYYHALKRRPGGGSGGDGGGSARVELLVFEGESHSLDGVEAARVSWEAGRDFLAEVRGLRG